MVDSVSKIRKGLGSNWLEEQATSAHIQWGAWGNCLTPLSLKVRNKSLKVRNKGLKVRNKASKLGIKGLHMKSQVKRTIDQVCPSVQYCTGHLESPQPCSTLILHEYSTASPRVGK